MTIRTFAGTELMNFSTSTVVKAGPVGLLGVHSNTTEVCAFTAAAMASRSCRPSGRFGISTASAPVVCTTIG